MYLLGELAPLFVVKSTFQRQVKLGWFWFLYFLFEELTGFRGGRVVSHVFFVLCNQVEQDWNPSEKRVLNLLVRLYKNLLKKLDTVFHAVV